MMLINFKKYALKTCFPKKLYQSFQNIIKYTYIAKSFHRKYINIKWEVNIYHIYIQRHIRLYLSFDLVSFFICIYLASKL